MKKMFKSILSLALILIVSGYVSAQSLPLMPADPAVSAGVLPNGMSYYIVENSTSKGLADIRNSASAKSGETDILPSKYAAGNEGLCGR